MKGRGKEEREGEVRGGERGSLSFALGRKKEKSAPMIQTAVDQTDFITIITNLNPNYLP